MEEQPEPKRWENIAYYMDYAAALLKIAFIMIMVIFMCLWHTEAGRKALAWLLG